MSKGVRIAAVGTALVGSALVVQGSVASASPDTPGSDQGPGDEVTLRFDVQFSPFSYTDLGEPGPSAADMIVFNDQLLREGHTVGHEVGNCVVVDASGLTNCTAVITLDGQGTIAFALENSPPPRKTLAVTGGSEAYRLVRGDGVLVENGDGTGTLTLHLDLD
jgi:hypothetical protein